MSTSSGSDDQDDLSFDQEEFEEPYNEAEEEHESHTFDHEGTQQELCFEIDVYGSSNDQEFFHVDLSESENASFCTGELEQMNQRVCSSTSAYELGHLPLPSSAKNIPCDYFYDGPNTRCKPMEAPDVSGIQYLNKEEYNQPPDQAFPTAHVDQRCEYESSSLEPSNRQTRVYSNFEPMNSPTWTYRGSGLNSKGNHWCSRNYGDEVPNQNPYHYSNQNGSYYYFNPDGSRYYNSGRGREWIQPKSGGRIHLSRR